jgi:DNA-directed RNA polymerase specialized sigma subunit
MLERLELSLSTCSELLHHLRQERGLEDYMSLLKELIDILKIIHHRWEEYGEVLDSYPSTQNVSYRVPTSASSSQGRPQFQITKEQLEYLSSLGFKWKEIAALLGVSRMTVYRY